MRRALLLSMGVLCVVGFLNGCGKRPELGKESQPEEARCDELIKNALETMYPDRLGITSNSGNVVGILNKWSSSCGTDIAFKSSLSAEETELLSGVLSSEELGRLEQSDYSTRDVEHVRDCLLYKSIVDSALISSKTDLDRCVELFYWVTRNIAIRPKGSLSVPLTPYEVMLMGRGKAEDRAWIFCNLLRQIRVDSVILHPVTAEGGAESAGAAERQSGKEGASGHWLVGALLDEKVYLFDMKLGLPIPSKSDAGESVLVSVPATLAEALASDTVFRRLDMNTEQLYPLKSRDLQSLHVGLIGNRSFWVPRMKTLQLSLSGESVLIFDGIDDSDFGDGLITRVLEYGAEKWKKSDLVIWDYPEKVFQKIAAANAEEKQVRVSLLRRFDAPLEAVPDVQTKQFKLDRPSKRQLNARVGQLMGGYGNILKKYQMLRQELMHPETTVSRETMISEELFKTYLQAAEDAFFWTGACQVEQKEYAAAIETLMQYRRQLGRDGAWLEHSGFLIALSYAESRKYAVALQGLNSELQSDRLNPIQRHGYQFIVDRWRTLRETASDKSGKEK